MVMMTVVPSNLMSSLRTSSLPLALRPLLPRLVGSAWTNRTTTDNVTTASTTTTTNTTTTTKLKMILLWNEFFSMKHFAFGEGREPFVRAGCRVDTCYVTSDHNFVPQSQVDALLVHARSPHKTLPSQRSPHTRYVFFVMEPAAHVFGLGRYKDVFNWTFTYRFDSDIQSNFYGRVVPRLQPLPPTDHNYAEGKSKVAAWFVSHCSTDSRREVLVETLKKWIPVDIFGQCGKLTCPRSNREKCKQMLAKHYKFYLSFENSLCKDYVTEKFFGILKVDVVPVVYGSANYSALAPPNSYIDALAFPSVEALAKHLLYLHHNDDAYNQYFRWKRYHEVKNQGTSNGFCNLCERLHTDNGTQTVDVYEWFSVGSHCRHHNSPEVRNFISGGHKKEGGFS